MPCTSGPSDSLYARFVPRRFWSKFFLIPFIGAPDGLFYAWKDNYPSASRKQGSRLDKFTLTAEELRTKFASGEWRLLEGNIP